MTSDKQSNGRQIEIES